MIAKKIILLIITLPYLVLYAHNTIKKIGVIGNKIIDSDVILLAIKAKVGDELTEESIQDNMKLIYELGYFSDVGAEIKNIENGKYLIFKVKENSIVKNIEFRGNHIFDTKTLKKTIKTKVGDIFNIPKFNEDIKNINTLYKDKGYILSRVINVDVTENGANIKIDIVEGRLEDIRVEGNEKTKDWVILREFEIKPGDVYNSFKIRRSLQKVFNLGYFETIKPSHIKGKKPEDVILVVNVKEQKTGTASFGGGYSSADGFVGFVKVSMRNFRGRGQTLNIKSEFGGITNYELGFIEPWFNHKPISVGTNIYNTKYIRDYYNESGDYLGNYDERRKGWDITVGKKLAYFTSGSINFKHESIDITPDNIPGLILTDDTMQTLTINIVRDSRDNVFQPTFGAYHNLSISKTGGLLKGKNNFTKYKTVLRRYFEIRPKNILAMRFIYGAIDLANGDVPEYEEFGLGGANTVRGYRSREFTGREVMISNIEFRHIFTDKFMAILFFDAGDINENVENRFTFNKQGIGIGISIRSPIGPIRLDYGKGNNGRGGRTYFTMAQNF